MTDKVSLIVEIDSSGAVTGAKVAADAIKKMTTAEQEFARAQAAVAAGSRKAHDVLTVKTGQARAAAAAEAELARKTEETNARLKQQAKDAQNSGDSLRGMVRGITMLTTAVAGVASGLLLASRYIISQADAMAGYRGQLMLVTEGTDELNDSLKRGLAISNESGGALQSTLQLYGRMARASEDLGLSQDQLWQITETVNKSFVVSGTTAQEASSAMLQLSQGLASGTLRGEELNAVMESSPRLAKAMADGIGISYGALRKMGKEGELTADVITRALLKMGGEIDAEFAQMPMTVSRATNVVRNELLTLFSSVDTSGVSDSVLEIAEQMKDPEFINAIQRLTKGLMDFTIWAMKAAEGFVTTADKIGEAAASLVLKLKLGSDSVGMMADATNVPFDQMEQKRAELVNRRDKLANKPWWRQGDSYQDKKDQTELEALNASILLLETSMQQRTAAQDVTRALTESEKKYSEQLKNSNTWSAESSVATGILNTQMVDLADTTLLNTAAQEAAHGEWLTSKETLSGLTEEQKKLDAELTHNASLVGLSAEQQYILNKLHDAGIDKNSELAKSYTSRLAAEYKELQMGKDLSHTYEKTIKQLDEEARLRGMTAREAAVETQILQLQKQAMAEKDPLNKAELSSLRERLGALWDMTHAAEENLSIGGQMRVAMEKDISLIGKDARATEKLNVITEYNTRLREGNKKAVEGELKMLLTQVDRKYDLLELEEKRTAALKQSTEGTDVWAEVTKNAIKRVDDAFADLWSRVFDGFDDFKDALVNSFKQMLAELAHAAITRPIVIAMGTALTGAGSTAQAATGSAANPGTLLAGAKDLYSSWKTAESTMAFVSGGVNALGMKGYTALAGFDSVAAANMVEAGDLVTSQFGGAGASTGANFATAAAGAAIAGYAGGKIGDLVFQNKGSTGLGAAGGSMAGAYIGSVILPGVGTYIGAAIGGFVGEGFEKLVGSLTGYSGQKKNRASGKFDTETDTFTNDSGKHDADNLRNANDLFAVFNEMADVLGAELKTSIRVSNRDGIELGGIGKFKDGGQAVDAVFNKLMESSTKLSAGMKAVVNEFNGTTGQALELASGLVEVFGASTELSERMQVLLNEFDGTTQETLQLAKAMQSLYGAGEGIPDQIFSIVRAFDGTTDALLRFINVFSILKEQLKVRPAATADKDFKLASGNELLTTTYAKQLATISGLMRGTSHTTEELERMSVAIGLNQQLAYDLATALYTLKDSIQETVKATAESYREAGRSPVENVQADLKRMDELNKLMHNTLDPVALKDYFNEWMMLQKEVFDATKGNVDPAELKGFTEQFAKAAEDMGAMVTWRINMSLKNIGDTQQAMRDGLEAMLTAQAASMAKAADQIAAAAEQQRTAINAFAAAVQVFAANNKITVALDYSGTAGGEVQT